MTTAVTTTAPDFICTFFDTNARQTFKKESDRSGDLNGIYDIILTPAPTATNTYRSINNIRLHNKDSVPVTVQIKYDTGGVQRLLAQVVLRVGEVWYNDGSFIGVSAGDPYFEPTIIPVSGTDTRILYKAEWIKYGPVPDLEIFTRDESTGAEIPIETQPQYFNLPEPETIVITLPGDPGTTWFIRVGKQ